MLLEVLLFASLKDALGPAVSVEVAETGPGVTDVAHVRQALEAAYPLLARLGPRALLAVNERHATGSDPVRPADEVALLPPLAGG